MVTATSIDRFLGLDSDHLTPVMANAILAFNSTEEVNRRVTELNRQLTLLRQQQDQLLNLRLLEEIDQGTFASKGTELRDRLAKLTLQIESRDRGRSEVGEIAVKAFELSPVLRENGLNSNGLPPITVPNVGYSKSSV